MLVAVAVCLGASCAPDDSMLKHARALNRGDTRARALLALGAPDDNQSEDDDEVLQYCKSPAVVGDSGEYALVWLYKGEVTGVTTYRRALTGAAPCAGGFKAVHWEDAPDRVIGRREPQL